jgi:hypothetical protein
MLMYLLPFHMFFIKVLIKALHFCHVKGWCKFYRFEGSNMWKGRLAPLNVILNNFFTYVVWEKHPPKLGHWYEAADYCFHQVVKRREWWFSNNDGGGARMMATTNKLAGASVDIGAAFSCLPKVSFFLFGLYTSVYLIKYPWIPLEYDCRIWFE